MSLSTCCSASVRIAGSGEGTHWHECSMCGGVCDAATDTRAAFEAFVQDRNSGNADLTRVGESYRHPLVASAWAVWQAAMLCKVKQP